MTLGIRQVGKAQDFDSCMHWFESSIPSQRYDPLAQSVEHLTFNQGVPRSSRGWVTILKIKSNTEGYRSGHNGAVLKTVRVQAHVGSNPTPSARYAQIAQSVEQGTENPRVGGSIPPLGTTFAF